MCWAENGNCRSLLACRMARAVLKSLQRRVEDITPRVLSKELKEMELNDLVTRKVISSTPVTVEYSLTAYSDTLFPLTTALHQWGSQHRKRVFEKSRQEREEKQLQSQPA